jgi:hypothetical protein
MIARSAAPASAGARAPHVRLLAVRRALPMLTVVALYALGIGLLLDVALAVWP